ncbi:hypothetical protein [Microbacterium sp. T2.11-28]|uniref:hypothetical protein n=1 Tax=Microbacterium sp. T2.11-28 TaxID=3041169 RepID=UPI0024776B86|nr:hypothetical protein [Microbacterium sp. T2.11-28]CAI9386081.1 hypothetical protein MICABA_00162 [Microbacterium sp. T2.11-28]
MTLPEAVQAHHLLDEDAWIAFRDAGIAPLHESELVTSEEARAEFLVGAWLLGLLSTIQPQMLRVVDMLTAGKMMNAVIMPRRSSKTTTLFCILLGRCYLRPVHLAGFTLLTTQKKTAERYRLDVYGPIYRAWPAAAEREAFTKGAPVKLVKSNGGERVEFKNGSVLAALSPDGDAIRSGAYDTLLLDESGEATPERWEDVIGAVIPSFDTRPEGQLILAGTAGDYRGGSEFWDTLNDPDAGVIRYTIPDDTDPEELEAWEPDEEHPIARVRELVEAMHPGLFGLTTSDRIANSFKRLGVKKFIREYLGLFGEEGGGTTLISQPKWTGTRLDETAASVALPAVLALAIAIDPDGRWCSLAAAWKGTGDKRHVALLEHQSGVHGFGAKVARISRKLNRRVIYDPGRATENVEITALRAARPPIRVRPLLRNDIPRAAVLFMKTLSAENLVHYTGQDQLDGAAEIAVRRAFGVSGAWAFGRPDEKNRPEDDITPLEAASRALFALDDERPATTGLGITGV